MLKHPRFIGATALCVIFAGSAFGQIPIGTIEVSDSQLPYIAAHCEKLASLDREDRDDYEPPLSQIVASGVRLKSISIADCQKAGLI